MILCIVDFNHTIGNVDETVYNVAEHGECIVNLQSNYVGPGSSATIPRPHGVRQLRSKFSDFNGIPSHIVDKIQLKSTSSASCVSLTNYFSSLPVDPLPVHLVAIQSKFLSQPPISRL